MNTQANKRHGIGRLDNALAGLGVRQTHMLAFYLRVGRDNWHSLASDPYTKRIGDALTERGLLITNEHGQHSAAPALFDHFGIASTKGAE